MAAATATATAAVAAAPSLPLSLLGAHDLDAAERVLRALLAESQARLHALREHRDASVVDDAPEGRHGWRLAFLVPDLLCRVWRD